jgi:hypothetical protein
MGSMFGQVNPAPAGPIPVLHGAPELNRRPCRTRFRRNHRGSTGRSTNPQFDWLNDFVKQNGARQWAAADQGFIEERFTKPLGMNSTGLATRIGRKRQCRSCTYACCRPGLRISCRRDTPLLGELPQSYPPSCTCYEPPTKHECRRDSRCRWSTGAPMAFGADDRQWAWPPPVKSTPECRAAIRHYRSKIVRSRIPARRHQVSQQHQQSPR